MAELEEVDGSQGQGAQGSGQAGAGQTAQGSGQAGAGQTARGQGDKKGHHREARSKTQEYQHKHPHSYPLGLSDSRVFRTSQSESI